MKESFQCLYEKIIPLQVKFIDSVYEKIKTIILKCFWRNIQYLSNKYFDGSEIFQQIKLNVYIYIKKQIIDHQSS